MADDGTKTALAVVDASRARTLAPDLLGLAHELLHPEPGPEALAGLLAHTDTQAEVRDA